MKKLLKYFIITAMAFIIVLAKPQNASASTAKIKVSPYGTSISVTVPASNYNLEVQVLNQKNEVVETRNTYGTLTILSFNNLKKNKVYFVRYRAVDEEGNALTDWNGNYGIVTFYLMPKKGKGMSISYKIPKIKGIKNVKVSISKKAKKGFKKVRTVKPGKKIVIRKYKGKSLKYTTYYVRFQPKFKAKVKKMKFMYQTGFHIYKRFTWK